MVNNIVIGNGQEGTCTIRSVLTIMRKCEYDKLKFLKNWWILGRELGVDEVTLEMLRRNLQFDNINFDDLTFELLNTWTAKESTNATLMKLCSALEECGLKKMSNELQERLISSVVPEKLKYYIPRTLSLQNRLDPKIFKEETSDIFVISGLKDRVKLKKLAEGNRTDMSRNQTWSVTARFIFLQHPSDYDKICQRAEKSTVHLIHHENGAFLCRKTQGSLMLIHKFIHEEQKLLTEEEFVNNVLSDFNTKPVCITDFPGMGKTLLLQSLARQVQAKFRDRTVLFYSINEFILQFGSIVNDPKELWCILSTQASSNISDKVGLELFLDAYDEVLSGQIEKGKQVFRALKQLSKVRIYVTTRPHMREELEECLGVLGYNIQPFDLNNQIEFLRRFWLTHSQAEDNEKLIRFSKCCLENLKKNIRDSERCIAGIPLQCRMIAEIYAEDVSCVTTESNSLHRRHYIVDPHSLSLFHLYQRLVDYKFEKFLRQHPDLHRDVILQAHTKRAMEIIFPEWLLSSPKCFERLTSDVSRVQAYGVGLIEDSGLITRFVHRTFAEYLIAQHIVQNINDCKDCIMLLFERVLGQCQPHKLPHIGYCSPLQSLKDLQMYKSEYPVISYFVNFFLDKTQVYHDNIKTLAEPFTLQTNFDHGSSFKLLSACTVNCLHHCFQMIYLTIPVQLDETMLVPLVNATAYFSRNIKMMEVVIHFVERCGKKITQLPYPFYEDMNSEKMSPLTPLHVAIIRGSYTLTEYFVSVYGDQLHHLPNLLNVCVLLSKYDSMEIVAEKKHIIKLLITTNKATLTEKYYGETPLLQDDVHPALIRRLIEEGDDVNQFDIFGHSLLHNIPCSLRESPVERIELFRLILTCGFTLFNHKDRDGQTPLHKAVEYFEPDDQILEYFRSNHFNFNSGDNKNDSVLILAIKRNRSADFIDKLIHTYGCQIKMPLTTALHVAAFSRNYDVVRYLVEKNICSCNDIDIEGNTPLHTAFQNESNELVQIYLIDHGANLEAKNKQGFIPFTYAVVQGTLLSIEVILKMKEMGLNIRRCANQVLYYMENYDSTVLRYLVEEESADINQLDENGDSLLHTYMKTTNRYDLENEGIENIKLLIWLGFRLFNHKNKALRTPLHLAVENYEPDDQTLGFFRSLNVDFNSCDAEGYSILHLAINAGSSAEFIHKLIHTYDCKLTKTADGSSALHIAAKNGNYDVVEYLVEENSCLINDIDNGGNTPLHIALEREWWGSESIQTYLIEHGANLEVVNNKGFIPLTWALQNRKLLSLKVVFKMEERGFKTERYANQALQIMKTSYDKSDDALFIFDANYPLYQALYKHLMAKI